MERKSLVIEYFWVLIFWIIIPIFLVTFGTWFVTQNSAFQIIYMYTQMDSTERVCYREFEKYSGYRSSPFSLTVPSIHVFPRESHAEWKVSFLDNIKLNSQSELVVFGKGSADGTSESYLYKHRRVNGKLVPFLGSIHNPECPFAVIAF